MGARLDDEKLEMLRDWGSGLVEDDRDEVRAAGRAILMLMEEIDRLQVDMWHANLAASSSEPVASSERSQPARSAPWRGTSARGAAGAPRPAPSS